VRKESDERIILRKEYEYKKKIIKDKRKMRDSDTEEINKIENNLIKKIYKGIKPDSMRRKIKREV